MSGDEQEQDTEDRTTRTNSKERAIDGEFSKSRSRDLDGEALGGKREIPEDAEHVTMAPEHVPMQVRTDDESDSEGE